jgi:polynucleotide 5'-kinase involved in rRNA processing
MRGEFKNSFSTMNSLSKFSSNFTSSFNCNEIEHYQVNHNNDNSQILETLILGNLEIYEDKLKILVIGDKKSGKTSFIDSIVNLDKNEKNLEIFENLKYIPTESIDIRKSMIKISSKIIKLEMFDTNKTISNSNVFNCKFIFKSKHIIKLHMQLLLFAK